MSPASTPTASRRAALVSFVAAQRLFISLWVLAAVAVAVATTGGMAMPDSLVWLRPAEIADAGPLDWHRGAYLDAPVGGAPSEVFTAEFRVDADGRPRGRRWATNLTRTAEGQEVSLVSDGAGRIAFASRAGGVHRTVAVLDFAGEPASLTEGWSREQRLANRVTNLQKTGQLGGLHWRNFLFGDPPEELRLGFRGAVLEVEGGGGRFEIDGAGETSSPAVIAQRMVKAPPAMLAWAVDTARAVPWIGKEKIAFAEKYWFDLNDWLARKRYEMGGDQGVGLTLPVAGGSEASRAMETLPDWPPADIEPRLEKTLEGEGRWLPVTDELFAAPTDGPPLFYSTFLRTDPERPFARVAMTVWDPARVELRMVAGVLEPISSTGLKGTGEVPREEVGRIVGAFNGAFQALHGEWGMVLDRRPLLPPKPYGATVARLADGRVAFGTWPNPGDELPPEIEDLRQNLLPLVERGRINPYRLRWWGSAPQGFTDRVYTIRTGTCLTEMGKVIYFFGEHLSSRTLGEAMLAAGCDYGVHLDMNPGHCGFEYYRVDPAGEEPPRSRPLLEGDEAEGAIPRRDDLFFRARKLTGGMQHMRFPRYVGRDPRDFFYLLRRPSIFDDPPRGGDGWAAVSPVAGHPVAVVTDTRKDGVTLTKVDLGQVSLGVGEERGERVLATVPFGTAGGGFATGLRLEGRLVEELRSGEPALRLDRGEVNLLAADATMEGSDLVQGLPRAIAAEVGATSAVAMTDDGYLLIARREAGTPAALFEALASAGGSNVMGLMPPADGDLRWIRIERDQTPASKRIFTDVEPVMPHIWREVYRQRGRLLDHGDGG